MFAAILACNADFKTLKDPIRIKAFRFLKFLTTYGWYPGKTLETWFSTIIEELTGNTKIDFQQVYEKYGKDLYLVATNIDKSSTSIFSRFTTPTLNIVSAVRMSASYPYLYEPVRYQNDLYLDGGLLLNFPIHIFDNIGSFESTLGFVLVSSRKLNEIQSPKDRPINNISGFNKRVIEMLRILISNELL